MMALATTKAKAMDHKGRSQRNASSDFKKIKAKVGKRAPKKLNATDTSFQSSKVQLRSQQLQPTKTSSSSLVLDNRKENEVKNLVADPHGDHEATFISQLTQSLSVAWIRLNHPASPVRISVLETVRGILFTEQSLLFRKSQKIRRHIPLAIVLPSLFKCLVDDDGKVRTLAISLLVDVIGIFQTNTASDAGHVTSIDMQLPFKPFIPLFLAYILSAFHSLDNDIRYNGCIAFHLLSANFPTILSELDCYIQQIPTVLAAFVTLLSDISLIHPKTRSSGNKHSNCAQMKGGISWIPLTSPKSIGILHSLQSFLNVIVLDSSTNLSFPVKNRWSSGKNYYPAIDPAHFAFTVRGHKSNALLCINASTRYTHIHSVSSLTAWNQVAQIIGPSESYNLSSTLSSVVTQILEKLRDRFVEVIQFEESMDIRDSAIKKNASVGEGVFIPDAVLDEISLILNSFHKVWICWCQSPLKDTSFSSTYHPILVPILSRIMKLFLKSFPFKSKDSSRQEQKVHIINSTMALFIFDLGQSLPSEKIYLKVLFQYCKSFLEMNDFVDDTIDAETPGESHGSTRLQLRFIHNPIALNSVLDLVEKLLFSEHDSKLMHTQCDSNRIDDINEEWFALLAIFSDNFFPIQQSPSDQIMKSNCGRKAVSILTSLFNQSFGNCTNTQNSQRSEYILQRMLVLPIYLLCWSGDKEYQHDCINVLAEFYSIARHGLFSTSDNSKNNDLSLLRNVANAWKDAIPLLDRNYIRENGDEIVNNHLSEIIPLPVIGKSLLISVMNSL